MNRTQMLDSINVDVCLELKKQITRLGCSVLRGKNQADGWNSFIRLHIVVIQELAERWHVVALYDHLEAVSTVCVERSVVEAVFIVLALHLRRNECLTSSQIADLRQFS